MLANRVASWTHKHGSRRIGATTLIAGLIPRATEVTDPDLGQALIEREHAIEQRAIALAERAIEERAKWVQLLGQVPSDPAHQAAWLANVATIAAYRERWNITGNTVIGKELDVDSIEQLGQWRRARVAARAAIKIGGGDGTGDTGNIDATTRDPAPSNQLLRLEHANRTGYLEERGRYIADQL